MRRGRALTGPLSIQGYHIMQKDFSHKQNTHSLRKLSEKDFITTH